MVVIIIVEWKRKSASLRIASVFAKLVALAPNKIIVKRALNVSDATLANNASVKYLFTVKHCQGRINLLIESNNFIISLNI